MFRTSSRCSPWLALLCAACATTPTKTPPASAPSESATAPAAPARPVIPVGPAAIEVRDLNLGLERFKSSLRLLGEPVPFWATDQRRVWALKDAGEGRTASLLQFADESWMSYGFTSTGKGWAFATVREVAFFEAGQLRRFCDVGPRVASLAQAPNGGVIVEMDEKPTIVARDAQCLEQWSSSAIERMVHASGDWIYGTSGADTLVRLAIGDGSVGGALKLSGRIVSRGHVAQGAIYFVTQQGDGRGAGTSATSVERIELATWKVTAQPLGPQPSEPSIYSYDVQTGEQGVIVVAKSKPATLLALHGGEVRPLVVPGVDDFGYAGYLAEVGPRIVVAAQNRLHFFDPTSGRLEGSVGLGRSISRVVNVEGELLAVTEKALFRLRGTATPARARENLASIRARPIQPGAVAALTDKDPATSFSFVGKAVIELTFTRPVLLQKLELAMQTERPELAVRVTRRAFCVTEARSDCWDSSLKDGEPLLNGPELTRGVVLELACVAPQAFPSDLSQRCSVTELQFE